MEQDLYMRVKNQVSKLKECIGLISLGSNLEDFEIQKIRETINLLEEIVNCHTTLNPC
jgi:hypothetical protein